jgi:hypothetical protein
MKTTRYFEEQILRKRPYIQRAWCERIVANPLRRETQRMAGFVTGESCPNWEGARFAW